MNQVIARQMIDADLLKLRRHRPTMVTAALLSAGMAIVYFAFIEARHHGNLAGPQALSDGASLTTRRFVSFLSLLQSPPSSPGDLMVAHLDAFQPRSPAPRPGRGRWQNCAGCSSCLTSSR